MPAGSSLTPRAKQVLILLLQGESEKSIANQLDISIHTVHVYVKSIYLHYDVSCRAKLMALWINALLTSTADSNDLGRTVAKQDLQKVASFTPICGASTISNGRLGANVNLKAERLST